MIRIHPALAKLVGLVEIPDEILDEALKRVKTRCAAVDLKIYKTPKAEERLAVEAIEAIVNSFRDHNPDADIRIRNGWPGVDVSLVGNIARFKIWLGHDYDTGDGIERFDVIVNRGPQKSSFIEKLKQRLASRGPKHEPELLLSKAAEPAPAPVEPKKSRAQSILDAGKR